MAGSSDRFLLSTILLCLHTSATKKHTPILPRPSSATKSLLSVDAAFGKCISRSPLPRGKQICKFNPTGKQGVYGGYQGWVDRAGRFRSLGDGQVDFKSVFSKLTAYDYTGWAVMEWECCIKHPEEGAKEGAVFIQNNIIRVTEKAFDDFAGTGSDENFNRSVLGLK